MQKLKLLLRNQGYPSVKLEISQEVALHTLQIYLLLRIAAFLICARLRRGKKLNKTDCLRPEVRSKTHTKLKRTQHTPATTVTK